MNRLDAPTDGLLSRQSKNHENAQSSVGAVRDNVERPPAKLLWNNRGCIFTFHRVAKTSDWSDLPNRGFYLDAGFLDRLLRWLKASGWDIVTMSEVLHRLRSGRTSRFVNFSIDDAYRDTWELAVPLFRRHHVPVTVYVTTGIPDGTDRMWTAGLESILLEQDRVVLSAGILDVRSARAKRAAFRKLLQTWEHDDAVGQFQNFCRINGYSSERLRDKHAISWEMLEAMRDDPFVEIGAHTVRHHRLSELSDACAWDEISGSRERLRQRLGAQIEHFAFPYGRRGDCGPREFRMAREAGFDTATTTRKSLLIGERHDAFTLPRITLNGGCRSISLTRAHLFGLSAAAARLTGRV